MNDGTFFASPERSSIDDIKQSNALLESEKTFLDAFSAISGIAAILDDNRQVIYANSEFLSLLGLTSLDPILGKRPGEAVSCIHQSDNINGCGTSEACRFCGAVNSIVKSQQTGQKTTGEARISTVINGMLSSLDLMVTTTPVKIRGRVFYSFSLKDISHEKRRYNLERIFFHDVLNSAGGLDGLLNLLKDETAPEKSKEIIELSVEASRDLIEEIMVHRHIKAAENGDLVPEIHKVDPEDVLRSAVKKISGHEAARGKKIIIEATSKNYLETDRILLQAVLVNMLKNALEASEAGGDVHAGVTAIGEKTRFYVRNGTYMQEDIQFQVFQRSFSTKGSGRGIGTYSIKLLSENYLNGKVGFTTSKSGGTEFYVTL
jgi:signal transduction histidine kinase